MNATRPLSFIFSIVLGGLSWAHQAAAQAAGGDMQSALLQLLPLVLIFGVFWLLLIRPQMKKQRDHQKKVAAVKKGDEVILSSGVYGKVVQLVDDIKVEVEIASGVKVKVAKAMLADVLTKPAPQAALSPKKK
ncbi:MAG: preprotein translocase subunit YajC [Alphaproteobacteria bacterium]|nr:preprotein translocase subunit YajC [Alphaproteobacteria bacterium]